MTDLEDLARRICAVLDDGDNLLSGSAMHSMLKAACMEKATSPPILDTCTDSDNCPRCKAHPNHRQGLFHAGIGWYPKTPEAQGWSAADADSGRASYEVPR